MMTSDFQHQTVLLNEAVEALSPSQGRFFIDGTFGRGGHTRLLLSKVSQEAQVLGFDRDPQAILTGQALEQEDARFSICQTSFSNMKAKADELGWTGKVHGILLDLGVSSPQLDDSERGFSFLRDGPLDMRMNPDEGQSAAQWLNSADDKDIADVLYQFGEERNSRRIARAIVARRQEKPWARTLELAELISQINGKKEKHKHPATRAFQAIRIHVNDELGELAKTLEHALSMLAPGGRLAVISFHSLEDRMVKRFIRFHEKGGDVPKGLPVTDDMLTRQFRSVGKAIKASEEELAVNARSRSAVLRVAERLG